MWFWKRWREQTKQYQELERLHRNDYELQHGPFGNAQYEYAFYRLLGDGDPHFPHMALSIMQEILSPFKVVTHVETWNFQQWERQKALKPQDYFPAHYYSGLVAADRAQNAYYNHGMELITLTEGMDIHLISALLDRDKREIWNSNVYQFAYSSYPFEGTSFEAIKTALNQDSCDRYVVYEEQHDVLRIIVNHASPMAEESIVALVQGICNRYNKRLEVTPTLI